MRIRVFLPEIRPNDATVAVLLVGTQLNELPVTEKVFEFDATPGDELKFTLNYKVSGDRTTKPVEYSFKAGDNPIKSARRLYIRSLVNARKPPKVELKRETPRPVEIPKPPAPPTPLQRSVARESVPASVSTGPASTLTPSDSMRAAKE